MYAGLAFVAAPVPHRNDREWLAGNFQRGLDAAHRIGTHGGQFQLAGLR